MAEDVVVVPFTWAAAVTCDSAFQVTADPASEAAQLVPEVGQVLFESIISVSPSALSWVTNILSTRPRSVFRL